MSRLDYLIIDCEARATQNPVLRTALEKAAREARPANNTRREIKEDWDTPWAIEERVAKAISDTSKDPLRAEILCICAESSSEEGAWVFDGMERDRRYALTEFAAFLEAQCSSETVFVGHNIVRYDLALLLTEWQRHRIQIPICFPVYRRLLGPGRWFGRIFDTNANCPAPAAFTSLTDACDLYKISCEPFYWEGEPMNGARVGEVYEAGDFASIRQYCCHDVADTHHLFLAMTCNATWGLHRPDDPTAEQLAEIASSQLTPAQKWTAATPILKAAGLL